MTAAEMAGRVYLSVKRAGQATILRFSKNQPDASSAWALMQGQVTEGQFADFAIPAPVQRIERGQVTLGNNGRAPIAFAATFSKKPVVLLQREGAAGVVVEPVVTDFTRKNGSSGDFTGVNVSATRIGLVSALLSLVAGSQLSGTIIHWAAIEAP